MHNTTSTCAVIAIAFSCSVCRADERPAPQRWQEQMDGFAAQDLTTPEASHDVVFVGSSSIRGWDLSKWFPDLPVINRGFGGSHIADSTHYIDVLVTKHKPKVVVFYAGDNDITWGLTPDEVVSDYRQFVNALQHNLPATRLVYVAIKPSIQRWAMYPKMREANQRIAKIAAQDQRQVFLDIATPMLATADGNPNAELFVEDGLHLNDAGYELWSKLLRPHLKL